MNAFDGKVVIEVRCNEYTMRDRNPNVPWSAEEIARDAEACREAGAAVVHFHARDERGGIDGRPEAYAEVIRATRARTDVVLDPTLGATTVPDPRERVAHIPVLAADTATRPDLAPVDLGSYNIDIYDPRTTSFLVESLVYATDVAGLRHEIEVIRSSGVAVQPVMWTVGSVRVLSAFIEMGVLTGPVYGQLTMSKTLLSAQPATTRGLLGMVDALPAGQQVAWTYNTIGSNALGLVHAAVEAGGGVAIGLGDYPYAELGIPTNADLVREVVRMIRAVGLTPATPDDVRAFLGGTP